MIVQKGNPTPEPFFTCTLYKVFSKPARKPHSENLIIQNTIPNCSKRVLYGVCAISTIWGEIIEI